MLLFEYIKQKKEHLSRRVVFVALVFALHIGWVQASPEHSPLDYPEHSPLAGYSTYRIHITTNGVYKITTADIPSLSGLTTNRIALYGNSGSMLAETNGSGMSHPLLNLPIWIADNNQNGIFDSDDYILFYGEGVDHWCLKDGDYRYLRHVYATSNCYYLTLHNMGRTITMADNINCVSDTISTHTVVAVHHNDQYNLLQTGQVWLGERFSSTQTSRTISLTVPYPVQGSTVNIRYALANDGDHDATFNVKMNGSAINSFISKNNVYRNFEAQLPSHNATTYNIQFNYSAANSTASAYLDYVELTAPARMHYNNSQTWLRTTNNNIEKAVYYRIENSSNTLRAWDITNFDSIYEVPIRTIQSNTLLTVRDGSARQLILFENTQALHPQRIEAITPADLAGATPPDMVIVAPTIFSAQAERLADLHREKDGLRVLVAQPQEIYDEYSSGKQDPLAFRELLRSYYKRYGTTYPRYLLLMGKGTYDPRNILGNNSNILVTCEAYSSFEDNGNAYCSDDMMGYLDDGESYKQTESMDVAVGRLPVKNELEAAHIVDKIERYLTRQDLLQNDPYGDWHNNIVLLADDADPSSTHDTIFTHDAEKLATTIKKQRNQYNISRIYADAFTQQSGSSGSYYPDVNNALKQQIDYGCLLLNYIGHGSTQYIGTERYITPDDINGYTNYNRLTFFVTSTCSFGRCDMTDDICGAERFLLADGGAIGIVTATRPIVHHEGFNTFVCTNLLNPANTVGDAWRMAKNRHSVSHSVTLLSDPALRLSIPEQQVAITHINHQPIDTLRGDTATALSEVVVEGHIIDANGFENSSFNGVLYITVYDREKTSYTQSNDNDNASVRFSQQKNILFRTRDSVHNGLFQYRFIVPMDIAYDYANCRLSHYAHDGIDDASGAYTHLLIGGYDTNGITHSYRPTIALYLNDTTFRTGGSCDDSPTLLAHITDSVGINAVGSGLGHDITAVLDNNGNSLIVLNDFYTTDIADSRCGKITYQLSGLSEGWHTLTVKVWNIFNLSESATIRFYVQNSKNPKVINFTASPNPAITHTSIRVEHNCPSKLENVTVELFDTRGRRVRIWQPTICNSYVVGPIEWDLCDESGNIVPNGIYIARVRYSIDGKDDQTYTKIVKTQ